MLLEKMYVRCPIDHDMINPRDFLMGQIVEIDNFADTVEVVFRDPFKYRKYYDGFPESAPLPTSLVQRCQFFSDSIVLYAKEKYRVVACIRDKEQYNRYYIENLYDKEIICVTEDKIIAPFTIGEEVREEQHYDTSAYLYRPMNQELISLVRYYNRNENKLFADAMLQWAMLSGFRDVVEKDEIISFNENSFSPRSAENSLLVPPDWNEYFQKKQNQFISRVKEMRQDKGKRPAVHNRAIEGTFSRKKAIANDYIHFFAPGDKIFDCIVDNAVRSCRGQSAAFAMKSNINWIGFVFTWSLYPNEKMLLDADIPLSFLSSFRSYLAVEQVQIPVRIWAEEETADDIVISEFNRILQKDIEKSRDEIEHLGKRGRSDGFLGIFNQYKCSNVDYFKDKNPQDIWEDHVKKARSISRNKAIKLLSSRSHVADAKAEMERILTSVIAKAKYFEQEPEGYDDLKKAYDVVLESLNKPTVRLESACYVRMVKTR